MTSKGYSEREYFDASTQMFWNEVKLASGERIQTEQLDNCGPRMFRFRANFSIFILQLAVGSQISFKMSRSEELRSVSIIFEY